MSRITRTDMLFEIARTVAKRSTCDRLHVGAVLSRDGRVITLGYNGAPAGVAHCVHPATEALGVGCTLAVHAEANAIAFAAKHGVSTEGAELHVTNMPCLKCSQLIINAGISSVSYLFSYRDPSGIVLLKEGGVNVNGPEADTHS